MVSNGLRGYIYYTIFRCFLLTDNVELVSHVDLRRGVHLALIYPRIPQLGELYLQGPVLGRLSCVEYLVGFKIG